jgi:hypothetical protein
MRQLHKHAEIGVAWIACGWATARRRTRLSNRDEVCRFSSERVDDSCGTGPCWQTLGERNLSNPHGVYRWLFTGRTT